MTDEDDLWWDLDRDPEKAWRELLALIDKAETAEHYGRIAALPLAHFWTDHHEEYLPIAAAVAPRLPQLANMLVAEERRISRACHVMNLISGVREPLRHEPPPELAAMVTPGAHPMTEALRIPNVYAGLFRSDTPPPTDEEQRQIIAGYLGDPDEWWESLNAVSRDHPRIALRMVREICADPAVDFGRVGAGPVEDLLTYAEDVIREDVLAALDDERFMEALSGANLFSLSEDFLEALAARLTSAPLRPKFTG